MNAVAEEGRKVAEALKATGKEEEAREVERIARAASAGAAGGGGGGGGGAAGGAGASGALSGDALSKAVAAAIAKLKAAGMDKEAAALEQMLEAMEAARRN